MFDKSVQFAFQPSEAPFNLSEGCPWQVPTAYTFENNIQFTGAKGILEFQLTPTEDVVYFASWAVHTYERESLNVARWVKSPLVKVQVWYTNVKVIDGA